MTARFESLLATPGIDRGVADRVREWFLTAPDSELFRINLVELAARFATDLRPLIDLFLYMTRAGLVDLSWDIHCPQCNVVLDRQGALETVRRVHHCSYCLKDVASRIDDHFEVTFTANQSFRNVTGRVGYQPSANVEILGRAKIAAGSSAREALEIPAHVKNLRFVSWPPLDVTVLAVEDEKGGDEIVFAEDGAIDFPGTVSSGAGAIAFVNRSGGVRNVMIENHDMMEYSPDQVAPRLRGIEITSSPVFREIFASDTLSDRESLGIRSVTILFTDITGSTALYESLGDIEAYNLVRDHFGILFEAIRRRNGHIVKTIGDAVMAGFLDPADAVGALIEVRSALEKFNDRSDAPGEIVIRAGVHSGTAILVTLNHALDYFGTTVNEAARIEQACPAGAIALSDATFRSPGVGEQLAGMTVESAELDLRGLSRRYLVHTVAPGHAEREAGAEKALRETRS